MTKEMELTKGKTAIVDDEDFERFSTFKWHCVGGNYAARTDKSGEERKMVYLHREIAKPPEGYFVDHTDGDKLNNTRENLRIVTPAENTYNKNGHPRNKSGYRGVSWHAEGLKWSTELSKGGVKYYLGLFENPKEAARIYDFWAADLFGEFARLNEIDGKKRTVVAQG